MAGKAASQERHREAMTSPEEVAAKEKTKSR